ncbi:MAG: hypothetical protein M3094_03545 [Actinomycetia bacterium]|nr:hypothetical protein [Actinomycetes bacterium]
MTQDSAPHDASEYTDPSGMFGASDRIELIATIALAIATVLTAWSAFQAGKWGGTQAINFSEAGAARTESTRADTRGGQLVQIDVAMYIDWVTAYSQEIKDGDVVLVSGAGYTPTDGTVSGFLYKRFRDEFRPAVDAWLTTEPMRNDDAPKTPFQMEEYVVAEQVKALELASLADEKAAAARTANQNGDNYVLTMVLFASVLFFAGVSSKLIKKRNRLFVMVFGVIILVSGIVILATLPILF